MSDHEGGPFAAGARRRSVDVGGLALALGNQGLGHGWGGWDEREMGEIRYAELLSEMYTETSTTINSFHDSFQPPYTSADTRRRLIESLDSWNFEPHKLPDEEVLACTVILFEVLFRIEGMQQVVGVSLHNITTLLCHLRHVYRTQNSYHNFQHALDVLQAIQTYLRAAGAVPPVSVLLPPRARGGGDDSEEAPAPRGWRPEKGALDGALLGLLDNRDIFTLYLAAIGHDVGHPGLTNVFMKNAGTPLSLVFDGKSALEQLHCALLILLMRRHGLGALVEPLRAGVGAADASCRKLLQHTVLATDMSVHHEFMARFRGMLDGAALAPCARKTLLCQGLLKCADISNPSRPYTVAQHWAAALAQEWSCQALLEAHFDLPLSVGAARGALAESMSQVWFVENFALPLLDVMVRAVPEMHPIAMQCERNLAEWKARAAQLAGEAPPAPSPTPLPASPAAFSAFCDAFPLSLPARPLPPLPERPPRARARLESSSSASSRADSLAGSAGAGGSSASSGAYATPPMSPSELTCASSCCSAGGGGDGPARPGSALSSRSHGSGVAGDAAAAMRAAYHASVRRKKSAHRSSWHTAGRAA